MEKKMTYAVALEKALEVVTDAEVAERLATLKASLAKRNTKKATGGVSKIAQANAAITAKLAEVLESGKVYTSADLVGIIPEVEKATPTKISTLMKPLVADGRVTLGKSKGHVTYTIV